MRRDINRLSVVMFAVERIARIFLARSFGGFLNGGSAIDPTKSALELL
jgi:hypothetical protein